MSSSSTPARDSSTVIRMPRQRSGSALSAFLFGVPLAVAILVTLQMGPWKGTLVHRYVSHPVEKVEIILFCCALGALFGKVLNVMKQRRAARWEILPAWQGEPVALSEGTVLLAHLSRLPRWVQKSWIAQRARSAVDFVVRRRSAAELDDHLRAESDYDLEGLERSYSLIRFLIWSMPILGFLGTVLGIAGAIAGVSPEVLEKSISTVTQGLALAFDTTGLALMLTIATMFINFLVERMEQQTLEDVDQYADLQLAHRFARPTAEQGPFVEAVQKSGQAVILATQQLVEKQADVWAQTLEATEDRRNQAESNQQVRFTQALEEVLQRTLNRHEQQLATLEHHQQLLQPMTEAMTKLTEALTQLQQQEGQLTRMQTLLQQNLSTLAAAGSFEQAVHSLTGAVHLMTAKSSGAGMRIFGEENAA